MKTPPGDLKPDDEKSFLLLTNLILKKKQVEFRKCDAYQLQLNRRRFQRRIQDISEKYLKGLIG